MKVAFELKDDADLCASIREIILGQVRSMIRSEMDGDLQKAIKDETARLGAMVSKRLSSQIETAFRYDPNLIVKVLHEELRVMIKDMVAKEIQAFDLHTMIEQQIAETLKEYGIRNNAESVLKGMIKTQLKAMLG